MLIFEFCTLKGPVKPDNKIAESLPPDSLAVNVYDLADRFDFTPITIDTIKGQFEYFDSNERARVYRSRFYPIYGDFLLSHTEEKGTYLLEVNGKKISIPPEVAMDVMSIGVYQFYHMGAPWLLLLGEGRYSTGSATAVRLYMTFNLEEETIKPYFFQSRYGTTKNIGYCNGDSTTLSFWGLWITPEAFQSYEIIKRSIVNDSIISSTDLPMRLRYIGNGVILVAAKDTSICMSTAQNGIDNH